MANPNKVAGRAKVFIDGALLATAGDTVLEPGGTMREGVDGDYEAGSFRESEKPAKIEVSVLAKSAFSPTAFGAIDNATVRIEFDTGQTFVIRNAWAESRPQMTTADGKAKGVLYGRPAEEVRQ